MTPLRTRVPVRALAPLLGGALLLPRADAAPVPLPHVLRLHEVTPFDTLVVLIPPGAAPAPPTRVSTSPPIVLREVPATREVPRWIEALPPETDAVLVPRYPGVPRRTVRDLALELLGREVPTFGLGGEAHLGLGMLAALSPSRSGVPTRPRGRDPTGLGDDPELLVSMSTARALGVHPGWAALTDAVLLDDAREPEGEPLTLAEAAQEAVDVSLDLLAKRQEVRAAQEEVARARAALRPQLLASLAGRSLDEDHARAGGGSDPEHRLAAGLRLLQLVHSESARAARDIQVHLQRNREYDRERLRLDVIEETTRAYLSVLEAENALRVARGRLGLARTNRARARRRRTPEGHEVARWSSEVSRARLGVLEARAAVKQAAFEFNRTLNREQTDPFQAEEVTLDDPGLLLSDPRVRRWLADPGSWRAYEDLLVEAGLERSPFLGAVDASIRAQERRLDAARRSYTVPTVALTGALEEELSRGGAGSSPGAPEGSLSWNLGVEATLPLHQGGARRAEVEQARRVLAQLAFERDGIEQLAIQRIRDAVVRVSASYPALALTRQAAGEAREHYDACASGYADGGCGLVTLLDAQETALARELEASRALYRFLADWMGIGRAVARFDFFMDAEERQRWFQRAELHMERQSR